MRNVINIKIYKVSPAFSETAVSKGRAFGRTPQSAKS